MKNNKTLLSKSAYFLLLLSFFFIPNFTFANSNKIPENDALHTLMTQGIATATIKLADKIKKCNNKHVIFQLNQEDKKHLKHYREFLVRLSLFSMKNDHRCSKPEKIQLESEFKKYHEALQTLSICPSCQKASMKMIKNLHQTRVDYEQHLNRDILEIPFGIRAYLEKRVANNIYNQSAIFTLMEGF